MDDLDQRERGVPLGLHGPQAPLVSEISARQQAYAEPSLQQELLQIRETFGLCGAALTGADRRLGPRRQTIRQSALNARSRDDGADHSGEGASRRTRLSSERAYLAWFCTGLGAIAGALVVGRAIPALLGGPRVAYAALGIGYAVLGACMIGYALVRARQIDRALAIDRPVPSRGRAAVLMLALSLALAVATMILVVATA